ncbi:response regulator [Candidatus Nitrososphaera sp. FF02]|uniref:response regulator n=1 Tax=Candidatus Nitrososphaera sp. FF02 TaxID=3398226 RepID=UPI0039EC7DF4
MRKQPIMMSSFAPVPQAGLWTTSLWALFWHARLAHTGANGSGNDGGSKKRIMIVDDEKDISTIFKLGLERHGFDVEIFNNPLDALSHFRPGYYDLLLLDVRMPQMSGFELYREIMKLDRSARIRLISAFETYEHGSDGHLPDGAGHIIKKPISVKELAGIISKETSRKI